MMIKVSRLDGSLLVLNADLIEFVEAIPETIVCLTTGKKFMVRESTEDIVERVAQFKRRSAPRPADWSTPQSEEGRTVWRMSLKKRS
jgi:flagellar protein FlbD